MWIRYSNIINALHVKTLDVSMLTPTKPGPSCHLLLTKSRVGSFTSHKDRNNERALRPAVPTVYHSYERRLECLTIL